MRTRTGISQTEPPIITPDEIRRLSAEIEAQTKQFLLDGGVIHVIKADDWYRKLKHKFKNKSSWDSKTKGPKV